MTLKHQLMQNYHKDLLKFKFHLFLKNKNFLICFCTIIWVIIFLLNKDNGNELVFKLTRIHVCLNIKYYLFTMFYLSNKEVF